MKNKKIIATCPAGLGNRIKCMVSTIKKGVEQSSLTFPKRKQSQHVYWPLNDACGCKFKELFQPIITEVQKSELNNAEINKSWKLISSNDNELDFQYHKLTQEEIDEFLPYFKYIIPSQDIQYMVYAFMNKYKESFERAEIIGVHIRKGDYKVSFDGRQYISTEDKFIKEIVQLLEINSNYKFLLCTENEETENKFKNTFNEGTIICFPKKFRGRKSSNSIKEAFVDMLLLSKCPIIIGTFLSTFTEVAWWFGECKAQVIIPGIEDKKAVDKVLKQLPQKEEGMHKKIWRQIKIWVKE